MSRSLSVCVFLLLIACTSGPKAATLTCTTTSSTLEQLAACVVAAIPRAGQGWIPPDDAALAAWREVAGAMLAGRCEDIDLPAALESFYSVAPFVDSTNGKRYCVLMETEDANNNGRVDHAWGTFITNASARRELHIHISHPLADAVTETQGIAVFKGVDARSFLLSGTHRDASSVLATCQGEPEADVAHNDRTAYHAAVEALAAAQQGATRAWTALQFHGMANSTCPGTDAYMTYGVAAPAGIPVPGNRALALRSAVLADHPDWTMTVPGDVPSCTLNATTNVQGQLLNGTPAADICSPVASTYTERFIHIEQKRCKGGTTTTCAASGPDAIRNAANWINALERTWAALVAIDVNGSGASTARIDLGASSVVFVAVRSSEVFDASSIDVATVRFGANGTEAAPIQSASKDVDGDGRRDLIVRFDVGDTGITCGDTTVGLTARASDGELLEGFRAIKTTGCR